MDELSIFLVTGFIGFVGTCGGVFVSYRMLKPNQQKVIAEAGKAKEEAQAIARTTAMAEAEKMLQRYGAIVAEQDAHLARCQEEINDLREREEAWERKSIKLERRVKELERRLRKAGIADQP